MILAPVAGEDLVVAVTIDVGHPESVAVGQGGLVMVSAGSACSSGKVTRSHVLDAMGVVPALAESAIRISLGWSSKAEDINQLVDAWGALYARTRASAA